MPAQLKPPALDPNEVTLDIGSSYPEPFNLRVSTRCRQRLGDMLGLKSFGVNVTTLPLGAVSALRHWHSHEEEFIYVLKGELVLVTNDGEQVLGPGNCAGFPAGKADGHYLVNRSSKHAVYLEVGTRHPQDVITYPDDDLVGRTSPRGRRYTRKDGTPY